MFTLEGFEEGTLLLILTINSKLNASDKERGNGTKCLFVIDGTFSIFWSQVPQALTTEDLRNI